MLSSICTLFLVLLIQTVKTDVSHTLARYNNQPPDIVYANSPGDVTDCLPDSPYVNAYNQPIYNSPQPYGQYYDSGSPLYPVYQPPFYPVNVGPPAFVGGHPGQPPIYIGHPGQVEPPVHVGHPVPVEPPVYVKPPTPIEPPVYHPEPNKPPTHEDHPEPPVHDTTEPAPYPPSNSYLPPDDDHKKIPVEGSDYHSQERSEDSRVESLAQKVRPRPIYYQRRQPVKFRQYHTETRRSQYKNAANVKQTTSTTTTEGPTCVRTTTEKQYAPPAVEIDRPSVNQTRTYEIRRPGIRKEFYDVEKRVIIRPVGSAVVEIENSQTSSSTLPTKVGPTTAKSVDISNEQYTPKTTRVHLNQRKLSEERGPTRFQINTHYAHIEFNNNQQEHHNKSTVQPPPIVYQVPVYSEKPTQQPSANDTSSNVPPYVYYDTSTQYSTTTPVPYQNYSSTNFVDIVYATNATSTTEGYATYIGPSESGNIDQLQYEFTQRGDSKAPNVHRIQHVDQFYQEDPKITYIIPKHVEIHSNGDPEKVNKESETDSNESLAPAASTDIETTTNTTNTIFVYPESEIQKNIHESHQRLIHLFSIKNDQSVPPQYESNGKEKILYVTPAPEYERVAASDAKTSVHRVVVSKPIETVHRIQVIESIKEHPAHGPTKVNSDGGSVEYVTPVPQMFARLRAGNPVPKTLL